MRKAEAELKRNTRKGKDNEEEGGFKAGWLISEEDKKEVGKGRQNEKIKAGGSSRTRQKGNRKSYNHV